MANRRLARPGEALRAAGSHTITSVSGLAPRDPTLWARGRRTVSPGPSACTDRLPGGAGPPGSAVLRPGIDSPEGGSRIALASTAALTFSGKDAEAGRDSGLFQFTLPLFS